jgi:hypothetical protein
MSENGHERLQEDLPAHLLGALAPEERAAMERHLARCERCREEERLLAPAVRALSESVPRLTPPPVLRERLLAEVGGSRPRSRRPVPALALAVAAALAVVAVVGYAVGNSGGGTTGVPVNGVVLDHAPGLTATMIREGVGGTLRLAHVHQLPGDEVLEAWVRRDGRVEAVPALFVPDRAGRATATIEDMEGVDTVMVTEEPKGGSSEPTSAPILTMAIRPAS